MSAEPMIEVQEVGVDKFALVVTFEGRRFECGTYVSRASAMQAGRLFVRRKEGERLGRSKRPPRKG